MAERAGIWRNLFTNRRAMMIYRSLRELSLFKDRHFSRSSLGRYGKDYLSHAASSIVSFAMIETQKGLDNLDEILAVDGLDGIFIGPADLALALGCPPKPDSTEPVVVEAVARILKATHAAGKRAGIYCGSGEGAHQRIAQGFDFVSCTPDLVMLTEAARKSVHEARHGIEK